MATVKEFRMSQERYDELKHELEYSKTTRADEIAELIKEARGFGDLSENSEYDEAKTEQGKLYSKIAELRNIVENAEIIETAENTKQVGLGSCVRVMDVELGEEEEYQIVGSQEANPMQGRISDDSPFGRGLLGHSVGEVVTVEAPAGTLSFKILSIENK